MLLINALNAVSSLLIACYGLHSLILSLLYLLQRRRPTQPFASVPDDLPHVTIQLPIYNEKYVVERLIAACAEMDYPRDRLQIQVLDDSTDGTCEIVARVAENWRRLGVDVVQVTRPTREGYKAGALQYGLRQARGEFLAVFDADFLPPPDFLQRTVGYFRDPQVGCVQARWDHLNPGYSHLTRAQSAAIDIHFRVEQAVRSGVGLFMNFNGAAGIWRRACIESVGGWSGETLTEDLDLSYRAQMTGWRFRFVDDLFVPAEVPVQINAYKQQQFRWAKGSIQTALKLLGSLWQSGTPWSKKVFGTFHLTGYIIHPLMLLMLVTAIPAALHPSPFYIPPWALIAAFGPWFLFWVSRQGTSETAVEKVALLILLICIGIGLAINNTKAILEALFGVQSGFLRTPKYNIKRAGESWGANHYALAREPLVWLEVGAALFSGWTVIVAIRHDLWALLPWLVLYTFGFAYVAGLGLRQAWEQASAQKSREAMA